MWLRVCWSFVLVIGGAKTELFSAEDNGRLPRLFHLDDYDRCLSQKNGVYCLGEFDLSPVKEPNDNFKLIKEYSSNPFTYNRSILHRGYCVSRRCAPEQNSTLRFERCVDKRARLRSLSATLRTASCTTRRERVERAKRQPDTAQQLFVKVVYGLLLLNLIGTVYDFYGDDKRKKNSLITAWSIRSSWRRLTATYENGDQRLKDLEPLQGMRVIALMFAILGHACTIHYHFYVINPNYLEWLTYSNFGVMLANGTSVIQWFVIVSSFLTAYNLLLYSEKYKLSLSALPMLIIKRVIRILPVHLILVGYAATWWPYAREGPLVDSILGKNSAICRKKFWAHAFFVNNVVDPREICLPPAWFLPVDMHLFIVSCLLTLIMISKRHLALGLYAKLVVFSSVLGGVIVYLNGWQAMIQISRPERIRGLFDKEESFAYFYVSSWGFLPASFIGLYMAHLQFQLQEKKFDYSKSCKRLRFVHSITIPLAVSWIIYIGTVVRQYDSPLVTALYVIFDRPMITLILFAFTFGVINFKGRLHDFLGWSGWRVLARLSLPIMLSHWIVNGIIATHPSAFEASWISIMTDHCATAAITIALSLVLSLCVEIPVQKFMSQILF